MSVLFYRTKYGNLSLNRFCVFQDLLCVFTHVSGLSFITELWLRPSLVQGVSIKFLRDGCYILKNWLISNYSLRNLRYVHDIKTTM